MSRTVQMSRHAWLRAAMEAVIQGGPISRAGIAKVTGLSRQVTADLVLQLVREGWIKEAAPAANSGEQQAATYVVAADAAYIASVDLGGTKVRAALTDLACNVIGEDVGLTDPRGGADIVAQVAMMCRSIAARQNIAWERVRLAVIGVPGAPQSDGRVLLSPNISHFDEFDVGAVFEAALGIDVVLENDVNLAVYGESAAGAGQEIDNLAFIALGTGVGGGLMLGGELVHGAASAAGELAFLPFGADPFEVESLHVGALERVLASFGMKTRYRELSGSGSSVPDIFSRAAAGDTAAEAVLDETARYLARGIAAICAVANPQLVILGGSIGVREELIGRVRALLPRCMPAAVEVAASALGAHASIKGAAALGLKHLHHTLFEPEEPRTKAGAPQGRPDIFQPSSYREILTVDDPSGGL